MASDFLVIVSENTSKVNPGVLFDPGCLMFYFYKMYVET